VLSGPSDKDRLNQVARMVYDQTEKKRRVKSGPVGERTGRPNSDIKNLKLEHVTRLNIAPGYSRKVVARFDPPIDASGLGWGFVPRWSPKSMAATLYGRATIMQDRCVDYRDVRRAISASTPPVRHRFPSGSMMRVVTNRSPAPPDFGKPLPFKRKVLPLEVFFGIDSSTRAAKRRHAYLAAEHGLIQRDRAGRGADRCPRP